MAVRLSKSDIAKEFEVFLDSNVDDLSPNMYAELISLFEFIDNEADILETEFEELKEENDNLKEEVEELTSQLEQE